MAESKQKAGEEMLFYKGKPLVRSGGTIYYGNPSDKYIAMLQILDEKEFQDTTLPSKVSVQILSTDTSLRPKERILKRSEKATLYDALNIATIWLSRTLGKDS